MTEKNKMRMDRDYDVLTEIYNRRAFYREARVLLEGGDLDVAALIMFDLDNLKSINDRYGHPFGDRYIKIAADHLSHLAKEKRIVGRQSGDEFLVFIYGRKSRDEVRALTDVFYQKLNRAEIELPDGNKRYMQISGGLAWYIKGDTYERLLDRADTALYEVKQTEKGTLIEFDTKAGQN
jgi:diguanylate cyclase (GGDEF)-like protein